MNSKKDADDISVVFVRRNLINLIFKMADDEIEEMSVAELRRELAGRNLSTVGKKAVLVGRLKTSRNSEMKKNIKRDPDDDDEMAKENCKTLFTFKDVEESLQSFSGDDNMNVEKWIEDFEDMAELLRWSELQKYIYVRRLLKGSAKLFMSCEKEITTYEDLKNSLVEEFEVTCNSAQIHKKLMDTTKKDNETYREYLYKMMAIGNQVDLDVDSLIQYVIDGINDEEVNKSVLYGAKTICELKKKLELYETMKMKSALKDAKPTHSATVKTSGVNETTNTSPSYARRCFSCGERGHETKTCTKGVKCFKCAQFGHIGKDCKIEEVKKINVCKIGRQSMQKKVNLFDLNVEALIDTGSDVNLVSTEVYFKCGAPPVKTLNLTLAAFGGYDVTTLGVFSAKIQFDDEIFETEMHVVADKHMNEKVILGNELLSEGVLTIDGLEITLKKRQKQVQSNEAGEKDKIVAAEDEGVWKDDMKNQITFNAKISEHQDVSGKDVKTKYGDHLINQTTMLNYDGIQIDRQQFSEGEKTGWKKNWPLKECQEQNEWPKKIKIKPRNRLKQKNEFSSEAYEDQDGRV